MVRQKTLVYFTLSRVRSMFFIFFVERIFFPRILSFFELVHVLCFRKSANFRKQAIVHPSFQKFALEGQTWLGLSFSSGKLQDWQKLWQYRQNKWTTCLVTLTYAVNYCKDKGWHHFDAWRSPKSLTHTAQKTMTECKPLANANRKPFHWWLFRWFGDLGQQRNVLHWPAMASLVILGCASLGWWSGQGDSSAMVCAQHIGVSSSERQCVLVPLFEDFAWTHWRVVSHGCVVILVAHYSSVTNGTG